MTTRPTLGQVLREVIAGPQAATLRLAPHQWQRVRALAAGRTGALGGPLFRCAACGRAHFGAHSCRNRHGPQCQGAKAVAWLAQQESALLPVPYFHLGFTLPHALNGLIRQNRAARFKLLFDAASQTLLEFGAGRRQAQLGITAGLHTWSQTLRDHYHLHCLVTGGGVAVDGARWIASPAPYLFPVRALSRMFRGKYLAGLQELQEAGRLEFHGARSALAKPRAFAAWRREAAAPEWVVQAKRPFAGPQQVLAYLSRYTQRVALSNRRLICSDAQTVAFAYKDYAPGATPKTMTLGVAEFVRRFCRHVLPERFVKIRHQGLLGNRARQERLARARTLLGVPPSAAPAEPAAGKEKRVEPPRPCCPFCQRPSLVLAGEVAPRRAVVTLDSS